MDKISVTINDIVRLKGARGRWVVHEIHRPTMEHEGVLVSLRPVGAPADKSCNGWPAHNYRTVRLDEIK